MLETNKTLLTHEFMRSIETHSLTEMKYSDKKKTIIMQKQDHFSIIEARKSSFLDTEGRIRQKTRVVMRLTH